MRAMPSALPGTVLAGAALAAALLAGPARAEPVEPWFFFFGDSATEQGNASVLEDRTGPFWEPYHCPDGLCRDSNGPVWVEFLGLEVDPVWAVDGEFDALNYAVSGAEMTEFGSIPGTGVAAQVGWLEEDVAAGLEVLPQDVFVIQAGPNDVRARFGDAPPDVIVADLVDAARSNVERLAAAGARRIMVNELLPLQLAPPYAGPGNVELRERIAALVDEANERMRAAVLAAAVPEGTRVDVFDLDPLVDWILANADRLGFEVLDEPCYDWDTLALCSENPAVQNTHLFFDPLHLTTPAQQIRAAYFRRNVEAAYGIELGGGPDHDFDRPAPIPAPAALPLALAGLAALALLRRRRN